MRNDDEETVNKGSTIGGAANPYRHRSLRKGKFESKKHISNFELGYKQTNLYRSLLKPGTNQTPQPSVPISYSTEMIQSAENFLLNPPMVADQNAVDFLQTALDTLAQEQGPDSLADRYAQRFELATSGIAQIVQQGESTLDKNADPRIQTLGLGGLLNQIGKHLRLDDSAKQALEAIKINFRNTGLSKHCSTLLNSSGKTL